MKDFPKVPRHDHPIIEDTNIWSSEDLVLLEKMDGQNFRFFLYEDYDYYLENIDKNDNLPSSVDKSKIEKGDIVFGTKKVIRGTTGMSKSEIDNRYNRAYEKLSEVDTSKLSEIQSKYGPLILFAEHMKPHTIKGYYKGENIVPPLLGFDIYSTRMDDREEYPSNPYKEKFIGFLNWKNSREIFEEIGVPFTNIVSKNPNISSFEEVESYQIPTSKYSNTPAEGIVFRSDNIDIRTKKTSEYFDEIKKKSWGIPKDEAENGQEYITAMAVTTPRVRKIFNKKVNKGEDYREIPQDVFEDIWEEELSEIQNLRMKTNPYKMKHLVLERCEGELEKIAESANVIEGFGEDYPDINIQELSIDKETRYTIEGDQIEEEIVNKLVDKELIYEIGKREYDEQLKREHIDKIYKLVTEELWYRNWDYIMNLDEEFIPSEISPKVAKVVAKTIS